MSKQEKLWGRGLASSRNRDLTTVDKQHRLRLRLVLVTGAAALVLWIGPVGSAFAQVQVPGNVGVDPASGFIVVTPGTSPPR